MARRENFSSRSCHNHTRSKQATYLGSSSSCRFPSSAQVQIDSDASKGRKPASKCAVRYTRIWPQSEKDPDQKKKIGTQSATCYCGHLSAAATTLQVPKVYQRSQHSQSQTETDYLRIRNRAYSIYYIVLKGWIPRDGLAWLLHWEAHLSAIQEFPRLRITNDYGPLYADVPVSRMERQLSLLAGQWVVLA